MSLTPSWCVRRDDPTGKQIKTFLDSLGIHIQAIMLVDEDGNPITSSDPLYVIVSGPVEVEQSNSDDLNANVNLQIGDLDVDPDNPVPIEEQETPPTASNKNNPSFAYTCVAGDLTQIDMTISGTTYTRTLAYVAGDLTSVSTWA